jgi:alpha-L-fucosidase
LYYTRGWNGKPQKENQHFIFVECIALKVYTQIAQSFNPVHFDVDVWVKSAKDAGMKYLVITAKHHDGFAMFNSSSDCYNLLKASPY